MVATAIDAETEYGDGLSVRDNGNRNYASELSKRQIYMLSGYNPEMGVFAGDPKDFPWHKVDRDGYLVAHNMGFDWAILHRLVEMGVAPEWTLDMPTMCTADMASYFSVARALNNAVKAVFDEDLDKGMRNWMKNKSWQDAIDQGKSEELLQYARDDSYWCYKLFEHFYPDFPKSEARLSEMTRRMAYKGLPFDLELAQTECSNLSHKRFELLQDMKWVDRRDDKYRQNYQPRSKRGLATECEKHNIPVPESTAKDNESFQQWVDKYADDYPFARAISEYQQVDSLGSRVKSMIARVYDRDGDPYMSYGLKYMGSDSTGRFSGDTGCNVQNFPREGKFGVYQRNYIRATEGNTLVICDLNAIEPHLMALVLEDDAMLSLLKEGYNPYEASARVTMGYSDDKPLKESNPDLYLLSKIRVLSLGYGAGWFRFYETIKNFGRLDILETDVLDSEVYAFGTYAKKYAKDKISEWKGLDEATKIHWVNAWKQFTSFRKANPKITKAWADLERKFRSSAGGDISFPLLNGESINFFKVRQEIRPKGFSCLTRRGDRKRTWFYGAKLLENIIQREARSVFSNGLLNLDDAGYDVLMHVHDEVVVQVPKDEAEEHAKKISECLTRPPAWIGDRLPIRAEYQISERFKK